MIRVVAPVLTEGVTESDIHLPQGDWYDYWTGKKYNGGQTIQLPVTLDSIPMFVRGGGFIFRQPTVQFTGQMSGQPLRVLIAPAKESEGSLYEDDGENLDYRQGKFMKRQFHQAKNDDGTTIDISAPNGSYRPATRDLILETWADHAPKSVSLEAGTTTSVTTELPYLKTDEITNSPSGWLFANGILTVKNNDRFDKMRFTINY